MKLRPYQEECVNLINSLESGSYLVAMATGLGKTVVFSHLERKGRVLILSHRDELVHQPEKYFDCSFGVEKAKHHSNGEDVVSASVQTLVRRLNKFSPDDFDMIITDEAHHAVAASYMKIYEYFNFRLHIGFTATPNRGDRVRLDKVFDKIIFQKNLKWGIENNYLTDIDCQLVDIGYDISKVKKTMGDFDAKQLGQAINKEKLNEGVAKAYREYAKGQTIIFATNIEHANNISKLIPGSVVVSASTKNRAEIIEKFTNREIPCIVNCMVFTEGTDIPLIETVMIARPTSNSSLYCLDEQTEILTEDGWKTDVSVGEKVAAFNMQTGEIVFTPALAKVRRKLEADEYFCSISGQSTDIRVTNKHRMVYDTKNRKGWKIREADRVADMRDGCYFPVAGETKFPGVPLTDAELTFIGWVMTDGYINPLNGQIQITQGAHQPYLEEIENCIKNCGFKFTRSQHHRDTSFNETSECVCWTISKGMPRGRDKHLTGWGRLEPWLSKDLSPALYDMTAEQFAVMLEAINHGDGHKNQWNSYHISKGNKTFIERLQFMAIQRGYRANIAVEKAGAVRKTDLYTLHIKKQNFVRVGSKYDGRPVWVKEPNTDEMCWCVQNSLGTLVTRRNGKVAIVGNCQMVGRGLRLYEGKECLTLIDCVGVTGKLDICTAPTLLGLDTSVVPDKKKDMIVGRLTELEDVISKLAETPEAWILNSQKVDLFAKERELDMHDINWVMMYNGSFLCSLGSDYGYLAITPANDLGLCSLIYKENFGRGMCIAHDVPMQEALDEANQFLIKYCLDAKKIWAMQEVKKWGKGRLSDKQLALINKLLKKPQNIKKFHSEDFDASKLTKYEASIIINKLLNEKIQ